MGPPRPLGFAALLVVTLVAALAGLRPAAAAADVTGRIDSVLHKKHLDGPGTGILVWDLEALQTSTPCTRPRR